MTLITAILQFLGPGMPPPWNPRLDLNSDGFITIMDLLIALTLL